MAGKGPPPKPQRLRQRTNRKAGAAKLPRKTAPRARVPPLFDRPCPCGGAQPKPKRRKRGPGRPPKPPAACPVCGGTGTIPWHPLTSAWWRDVWTSEVAHEYIGIDRHGLFRLAILVDTYWQHSDAGLGVRELGAEIRLQQQAYGLSPLDRSRLQWEIEHPEESEAKAEEDEPPVLDSRAIMRAVK